MIDVRNLYFSYGQKEILHDISFTAGSGEIVAILGNNGAGKSTLITCINKIRKMESGEVTIDGKPIQDMKRKDIARLVAYVPQKNDTSELSVFDCVLLGRKPYIRWNTDDNDIEICRDMIEKLGLESLQLRSMDELSGGEQQKVMLARALVQKPKVMLLDEPTSSLDPRNQFGMMALIRDIAKHDDITVLVVLHDLNLALRFCDRLFFLKDGRGFRYCTATELDSAAISEVYGIGADIIETGGSRFVMIREDNRYGHKQAMGKMQDIPRP